jgi:hypothetical protein
MAQYKNLRTALQGMSPAALMELAELGRVYKVSAMGEQTNMLFFNEGSRHMAIELLKMAKTSPAELHKTNLRDTYKLTKEKLRNG